MGRLPDRDGHRPGVIRQDRDFGNADLQVSAGGSGFEESLIDVMSGIAGVQRLTPVMEQTVTARLSEGRMSLVAYAAPLPEKVRVHPLKGLPWLIAFDVIDIDHVEWVDFGTGDDPYKRDWMEQVRTRYRLTCLRPGDPRNWPAIAKAWLRKLVSPRVAG